MSRALVLGATSQVGVFLLPRLLAAGVHVSAVSRRASMAPQREGLRWLHPSELDGLEQAPVPWLLSCGPIRLARDLAERQLPGWRRAIVLSTSSVLTKTDSADAFERGLVENILAYEQSVSRALDRQGVGLAMLRPTLIWGCGMDQNISRMYRWLGRWRLLPLAGAATGLRQPLHADDLAAVMAALLNSESLPDGPAVVCGAERLRFRQMAERLCLAQPGPCRVLALPRGLAEWLGGLAGTRAMVQRHNRDMVFDDAQIRACTGVAAMPFQPRREDFQLPEQAAALQPSGTE